MDNDNKFLASVALFAELYNSKKDIYDVLAELTKAAILSEAKWSFKTTEAKDLLQKTYNFDIPIAVISTTLRKKLKSKGFVAVEGENFTVVKKTQVNSVVNQEFEKLTSTQNVIVERLINYIAEQKKTEIKAEDQEKIKSSFYSYLLDNPISDEYQKCISTFIIENQNDSDFRANLNIIKEGLILYTAVIYTPNINEIASWNHDLTIFLDTEILFYLAGFNGEIYQEIFNELYGLILEINGSTKSKGRIHLRYFEDTEKEVNGFFYVAEKIVRNEATLDPSKTAMVAIVNGCKSPDEVIEKKSKFYDLLKSKNIKLETINDLYKNPKYNLQDLATIKQIHIEFPDGRYSVQEETQNLLGIFTKLNALRKGKSDLPLEQIGYILLTGKRDVIHIAFSKLIKEYERDYPLAIDIDSITNRLWFKLKRGFGNKKELPLSFDIVTKAQIVLSSQVSRSVSQEYEKLVEKRKRGELTKEQALSKYARLREKQIRPEEINTENLSEILDFINEGSLEQYSSENAYLRGQIDTTRDDLEKVKFQKEESDVEKENLRAKLEQKSLVEAQLRKRISEQKKEKKRPKKTIASLIYYASLTILAIIIMLIPYIVWRWVSYIATEQDTPISRLGLVITTIAAIVSMLSLFKLTPIPKWIKKKSQQYYLQAIKNIS